MLLFVVVRGQKLGYFINVVETDSIGPIHLDVAAEVERQSPVAETQQAQEVSK